MNTTRIFHAIAALFLGGMSASAQSAATPSAAVDGPVAFKAAKVLALPFEGEQVINNAVVLVKDGKIERVGSASEVEVPEGYHLIDLGKRWLAPGMIDLHSHVAGTFDINDMVYLTNPGLRASTAVVPENSTLRRGVAGGVTSILFIPGSGTNVGGQGVLLKTWAPTYEEMEIRNPGSLKLAQAGNPERYLFGITRTFMNWNTRNTFARGMAYAKRWQDYEKGKGEKPEKDLQFEVYRDLAAKKTQVSTHTQMFQVVGMTIEMIRKQFGIDVYIDHGTFDGWRAGGLAQEAGVPAILGPRGIDVPTASFIRWTGSNPERIQGVAAGYQQMGHKLIGFNTDAPVLPQEELHVQSAMGVRYGLDTSNLEHLRGLTIVPAIASGTSERIGSIEVGKDADLLIVNGDPADPRTAIDQVWIQGRLAYDAVGDLRIW